jgi:FkbM family methyltransferase
MRKFISSFIPPVVSELKASAYRLIFNKGGFGLDGLDIEVLQQIKPGTGGFFVELGANDGIRQSNSYLLQNKFFWGGVLIEPNPARFEECVINRATSENVHVYCAACVPFSYDQDFVKMSNSDLMSVALGLDLNSADSNSHAKVGSQFLQHPSLSYTFFANARTLTDILVDAAAPSNIDFLSLDVEGNELAVLKGLDFARYSPQWILVESRERSISDYLVSNNYELFHVFEKYSRQDLLLRKVS